MDYQTGLWEKYLVTGDWSQSKDVIMNREGPDQAALIWRLIWAFPVYIKQKSASEHAQNAKIQVILRISKVSFRLPFIHSVVSNGSVSRQWKPWSNCMDFQANLGPRCLHTAQRHVFSWHAHIVEGPFSHVTYHTHVHAYFIKIMRYSC